MAGRTYLQSLVDKSYDLQKYMTRYRTRAFNNLTDTQRAAYDATIDALDEMLLVIKKANVEPDFEA